MNQRWRSRGRGEGEEENTPIRTGGLSRTVQKDQGTPQWLVQKQRRSMDTALVWMVQVATGKAVSRTGAGEKPCLGLFGVG